MKLSAHYNKAIIIITIFVLLAGGVIYFFTINQLGRNQLDHDLKEEFDEVVDYINVNSKLPAQGDFDEDETVGVALLRETRVAAWRHRFRLSAFTQSYEKLRPAGAKV